MIALLLTALPLLSPDGGATANEISPLATPLEVTVEEARAARDRALAWLVAHQNDDGSWETGVIEGLVESGFPSESYFSWKSAASALACLALPEADETPERRAALDAGLGRRGDGRRPRRANDWDVDHVGSGLYGTAVLVRAARDERFTAEPGGTRLATGGAENLAILRQYPPAKGGGADNDDPIYSRRPNWDTGCCTALVLPALPGVLDPGWLDDAAVLARARRYALACAPPHGAWAYDLDALPAYGKIFGGEHIDAVEGSLGRIPVCPWGLATVGEKRITPERIREGLERFFRHHRFLDVAWLKPIPPESYYYNSGYFYLFGHYYAAEVIERLPEGERAAWPARLRPHLVPRQRSDGSTSTYAEVAGPAYLALHLDLGPAAEDVRLDPPPVR